MDLTIKKTNVNVLLGTAGSIPFILYLLCIGYIDISLRKMSFHSYVNGNSQTQGDLFKVHHTIKCLRILEVSLFCLCVKVICGSRTHSLHLYVYVTKPTDGRCGLQPEEKSVGVSPGRDWSWQSCVAALALRLSPSLWASSVDVLPVCTKQKFLSLLADTFLMPKCILCLEIC